MTSYEERKQRTVGVLLGGTVLVCASRRKVPLLCRPYRAAEAQTAAVHDAGPDETPWTVEG